MTVAVSPKKLKSRALLDGGGLSIPGRYFFDFLEGMPSNGLSAQKFLVGFVAQEWCTCLG